MSEATGSDRMAPKGGTLAEGEVLADRFKIANFMGVEIIGESYLADDLKESRRIAVTIIPPQFTKGLNILDKIKSEIKSASGIVHRNLLSCYGMGVLPTGSLYITTEYIEGQKLYSILQKRRESRKLFSLRGASNLIAHLCNGLEEIHKTRIHGSLSPFSIRISSAGRVKIADLPLSRLYYILPVMRKEIPSYIQGFWAPEVLRSGSVITERADVYSMGVILFELLSSTLPEEGAGSVRAYRNELPESIDDIAARCLDGDPSKRWNNVLALKTALLKVVEEHEMQEEAVPGNDDLLMDLEIDIAKPMQAAPPPPPPPQKKKPARPPAASASPAKAKKAPAAPAPAGGSESPFDDALDRAGEGAKPGAGKAGARAGIDLDEIVSSLEDQDAERWMVTRDGMDHGPFRTREVIQMITRWEIEGQHVIQDLDSGLRVKLRESEQFKELVERAKVEKQRHEELQALARSEKAEKRGGVAKVFIVASVLGGIGIIIGGYFLTRAAVQHFSGGGEEVDLAENINIDLGKGGIIDDQKKHGRGRRRKGPGGKIPAGMTYEEYMAMGVDMGNLDSDGGQVQLSQGQINSVMSRQGKKLYSCIYAELKRNPSLSKVSLKFAIQGSTGGVQGVTVTSGGSSEFKSCIARKMKGIKFPTFSAPRMGATFYFDVGR